MVFQIANAVENVIVKGREIVFGESSTSILKINIWFGQIMMIKRHGHMMEEIVVDLVPV
jgi:hypothetical protein